VRIGARIGILACAASLFVAAQDHNHGDAQSNILALERAWDQAQERGDIKALSALFDDSLIFVDFDGKILTKAQYLDRVKMDSSHLQQIVTESMNVQMFGNTAIVVGTYRAKGVENGKPYLRRRRFVDIWMLQGSLWICVAAEATRSCSEELQRGRSSCTVGLALRIG
jgi:ketosteroid isomerase-like protein